MLMWRATSRSEGYFIVPVTLVVRSTHGNEFELLYMDFQWSLWLDV